MRRSLALLLCAIAGCLPIRAEDPPTDTVAKAFPAGDGLVVQVGAANGAFLAALANEGKRMAHGLCLDDAIRDRARAELHQRNVHPLASVMTWHGSPRLPYADRLVNLLIIDRDALGAQAPSEAECRRVVGADGVILTRAGGSWKATAVPSPATYGNWSHFDGGADGNALSRDKMATGINTLQWIENARPLPWRKLGPHGGEGGNMRVWGRYAVVDFAIAKKEDRVQSLEDADYKAIDRVVLECRDVNNGLTLWQKKRSFNIARKRWGLVVDQGKCFTWLKEDGPLSAIDLATGEVVATYPGSELQVYLNTTHGSNPIVRNKGIRSDSHWVRVSGDILVANGQGTVRAWTLDGKPLWSFNREGSSFEIPVVDAERKRVYGMMTDYVEAPRHREDPMKYERWPTSQRVQGFIALDLATGKPVWENRELASRPSGFHRDNGSNPPISIGWGQLIVAGKHLIAFNTATIGGGDMLLAASLDPATGKTIAFDPTAFATMKKNGDKQIALFDGGARCIAYRDGKVLVLTSGGVREFDPLTGKQVLVADLKWNARCIRPVLTEDQILIGQTAFLGKDYNGTMFASARSGCNMSPVIGAGLVLFGPHTCGCVTHLDGHFATTSQPVGPPLEDRLRLIRPKPPALPAPPAMATPVASLLAENWSWFNISVPVAPRTTERDGWTFAVDPQRHRIDATGPDGKPWAYVGDARLGTDIVVTADRVVVGSHDGWVTGLDRATGAPVWRHLLAPSHRLILSNSMLTSTWPVFGVADLGNGQIVASAGLHAEFDGGLRVAALNAADGTQVWLKRLKKPTSPLTVGSKSSIVEFSVINNAPQVIEGKVAIKGRAHLGSLEFDPSESEDSLNARLAAGLKKKQ